MKRPLFATLLMEKAMAPALAMNVGKIEHEIDNAMERVWDHFERVA